MTKAQMEEKIARLEKKNHELENKVQDFSAGAFQVTRITDGIMAEVCMKYGTEVYEDAKVPEVCNIIGYRVEIPVPDVEIDRKLHVEKRDGNLIIGYMVEENNG